MRPAVFMPANEPYARAAIIAASELVHPRGPMLPPYDPAAVNCPKQFEPFFRAGHNGNPFDFGAFFYEGLRLFWKIEHFIPNSTTPLVLSIMATNAVSERG
jgi:hypothetical protein